MTVPLYALLGFSVWTLGIVVIAVGTYRWIRIVRGRARIHEFRAEAPEGEDWYRRAMRAHANCVENLPVFGAIVLTSAIARVTSSKLDVLAVAILTARIGQTISHVGFPQTERAVMVRFTFFLVQAIAMIAMIAIVLAG
jgi:uncharacterized MAPEG superfamily protein